MEVKSCNVWKRQRETNTIICVLHKSIDFTCVNFLFIFIAGWGFFLLSTTYYLFRHTIEAIYKKLEKYVPRYLLILADLALPFVIIK